MQYSQCVRCVMDNSDPEINFDGQGICNHCRQYEVDEKKRQAEAGNLPLILQELKKGCLLGISGGVDSSMCLHYLVENGIKPICFSLDNKWDTPESAANIKNLVEKLNVPYNKIPINMKIYRELQAAFLEGGIKNIEAITDHILFAVTYELAAKNRIKYIVTGGNLATENTMPSSWGEDPRDLYWIKSVYKKMTGKKLTALPMLPLWKEQYYRLVKRITFIPLLNYYQYDREEAKKLLNTLYDWQDYGDKHCENIWTWWFQNFYLFEKWGIDKRKAHLSSLINSGQMTRNEALEELKKSPVYPQLGIESRVLSYPKKGYHDFQNSEWIRKIIIKIYKYAKQARSIY